MTLSPRDDWNAYMREYMKRRARERRTEALNLLGGSCVRCGSTEALEFDHVDPATKSFEISKGGLKASRARFLAEVAKCQLLCRTHHRQKSAAERAVEHGSGVSGRRNCYCEKCKPLKRAYMQQWQQNRTKTDARSSAERTATS
jgi:hypothetical protein